MSEPIENMKMDDLVLLNGLAVKVCRIVSPSQGTNQMNLESALAMATLSARLLVTMQLEGVKPREMVMAAGALIGTLATKAADEKQSNQSKRN